MTGHSVFVYWKNRPRAWVYLTVGSGSLALSQWLMVWTLSYGATALAVGQFGIAMAWLSPIFGLSGLQLRSLLATECDIEASVSAYQTLFCIGLVVAMVLVLATVVIESGNPDLAYVVATASLLKFAEAFADYRYGMLLQAGRSLNIAVSQCMRAVLAVVSFSATCWLTSNLIWALCVSGLLSLCAVWLVDYRMGRTKLAESTGSGATLAADHVRLGQLHGSSGLLERVARRLPLCALDQERLSNLVFRADLSSGAKERGRSEAARKWVPVLSLSAVAVPLSCVAFLNQSVLALPRLFLAQFQSLEQVAAFTCLLSLLAPLLLAGSSYAAARSPNYAMSSSSGWVEHLLKEVWSDVHGLLVVGMVVSLSFVWIGGDLMTLIFGEAYRPGVFTRVAAGGFVFCWSIAAVCGTAATASRQIAPQAAAFGVAFAACLASGFFLVPRWGVAGAMWSLLSAGIVLMSTYVLWFYRLRLAERASKPSRESKNQIEMQMPNVAPKAEEPEWQVSKQIHATVAYRKATG